ncbi:hypothetical protein GCM10011380_00810 [Sphingomonas metalli]|uniref:Uncharacterized protein n=1 Tax=Sphingomonas metalli TaxID=1779358 RepID=A0A916SS07_9SPHN|nr:hypothetical protein [Sphingomonas metalli]GGB15224.1 hypothetical protein GCM10011380_00810 [Sphingomonas metalli]
MIWAASLLARIPERWRNAALVAVAVLAMAALGLFAAFMIDRVGARRAEQAINYDRTATSLDAAERTIAADRAATTNQTAADAAFSNSQEGLRNEVRTKGTDAPVGPAVAGVLDRLRDEQARAARRDTAR